MQRSVSIVSVCALSALLSAPAFAGEAYAFTSERRGGLLEDSTRGTILVDGIRYRIAYGTDDPMRTHGAVVSKDGGAHAFALNSKDRTYFALDDVAPNSPTSPLFGLIPVGGERTVENVKVEASVGGELETMAGLAVRRHDLALSYDISIAIKLPPPPDPRFKRPPPEVVRGRVKLQASFWMAEDRAPLPVREFRPEIQTGFPAVDERLRPALAALRGLTVKQQVAVTAAGDNGVAPRTETSVKVIESVSASKTQPALFEVPGGFRKHKPEITAPGVESAPGFEGR